MKCGRKDLTSGIVFQEECCMCRNPEGMQDIPQTGVHLWQIYHSPGHRFPLPKELHENNYFFKI
jgi:hypothetical protein